MRKADYALLAASVRAIVDTSNAEMVATRRAEGNGWDVAFARRGAALDIAHRFVEGASVDRAAFLTACGIAP